MDKNVDWREIRGMNYMGASSPRISTSGTYGALHCNQAGSTPKVPLSLDLTMTCLSLPVIMPLILA